MPLTPTGLPYHLSSFDRILSAAHGHALALRAFEGGSLQLLADFLEAVFVPFFRRLLRNLLIQMLRGDAKTMHVVDIFDQRFAMVPIIPLTPLNDSINEISAIFGDFKLLPAREDAIPGPAPEMVRLDPLVHEVATQASDAELSCSDCEIKGMKR